MSTPALFLDSSAIYALVDRDNVHGPAIERFMDTRCAAIVTTNFILAESMSLITKRLGKHIGIRTGKKMQESSFVELIYLDVELQQEAWSLYKKYTDKNFDLIDATSFVLCRRRSIHEIITLDHHFSQMGFAVVPE